MASILTGQENQGRNITSGVSQFTVSKQSPGAGMTVSGV